MNQPLILSERKVILSDDVAETFRRGAAQTPPSIGARTAADGAGAVRLLDRNVQALRSTKLPLCRRTRTWPQAISVHQPARRTTATRLRTKQCTSAGRRIDRQPSSDTQNAQRYLLDKRRALAPTREPGIGRDGLGAPRPRRRRSGRCRRGHDRVLSRQRRLASRRGGCQ